MKKNNMERANRIAVQVTGEGFKGSFYRTHKLVATVESMDTEWIADADATATANRESYRDFLITNAGKFGVDWNPSKSAQAWERKYDKYFTDEEVGEDALTLIAPSIERLADKSRYDMTIVSTEVTAITPKESTLTYVENGRYMKSGAWCVADIEVTIGTIVNGQALAILYNMEMKSGQICKPKTTIAEWNEMISREADLQGIIIEEEVEEVA